MVKHSITFLIFMIIFTIGYIRETVFLVVNSVLYSYSFPYNSSYVKPPDYLYEWTTNELTLLKWGLTICFAAISCGLTYLLVWFYFRNKKFKKITLLIYSLIGVFSALMIGLGLIFNAYGTFYSIARFFMGLAQYPILSLLLFSMFYFFDKYMKKNYAYPLSVTLP